MLLSVHIFTNEGIDVAIYETHHGGEFDAANIFPTPVVTGITNGSCSAAWSIA
jgi:folylpolyglutamate synthase